jgi:hypothetical protein
MERVIGPYSPPKMYIVESPRGDLLKGQVLPRSGFQEQEVQGGGGRCFRTWFIRAGRRRGFL